MAAGGHIWKSATWGYSETCHGQDQGCSPYFKSRTSTSDNCRSAYLCDSKANTMEMAWWVWRGTFCHNVLWPAHRDDSSSKSCHLDNGWTGVLTEAGVASSGTSESFLTASSVTKTRQVHQVTACSLYKLLKAAYTAYEEDLDDPMKPWVWRIGLRIGSNKVHNFSTGT